MTYTGNASRGRFDGLVSDIRSMDQSPGRDVLISVATDMVDDVFVSYDVKTQRDRVAAAAAGGGVVMRVIVMRMNSELREVVVALPYGDETHERVARDMLKWATGREWSQIGSFGREERAEQPSVRVSTYFEMR